MKAFWILKTASLFKVKIGVYHYNKIEFAPKSVTYISFVIVLITFVKIFLAMQDYNQVDGIIV